MTTTGCFGRGCADMKGGLSAALEIVLGEECFENTILFVAVYDEENLSCGKCAVPCLSSAGCGMSMIWIFACA